LGGIAQAAGNSAPASIFKGVEGVRAAPHLLSILADGFDELLGDGAAADLIEVFDLREELAAAGMELGDGGWCANYVVFPTTYFRLKKGEKLQNPIFCHAPALASGVAITQTFG